MTKKNKAISSIKQRKGFEGIEPSEIMDMSIQLDQAVKFAKYLTEDDAMNKLFKRVKLRIAFNNDEKSQVEKAISDFSQKNPKVAEHGFGWHGVSLLRYFYENNWDAIDGVAARTHLKNRDQEIQMVIQYAELLYENDDFMEGWIRVESSLEVELKYRDKDYVTWAQLDNTFCELNPHAHRNGGGIQMYGRHLIYFIWTKKVNMLHLPENYNYLSYKLTMNERGSSPDFYTFDDRFDQGQGIYK